MYHRPAGLYGQHHRQNMIPYSLYGRVSFILDRASITFGPKERSKITSTRSMMRPAVAGSIRVKVKNNYICSLQNNIW
jgi:hypothetical protein